MWKGGVSMHNSGYQRIFSQPAARYVHRLTFQRRLSLLSKVNDVFSRYNRRTLFCISDVPVAASALRQSRHFT